MSNWKHKIQLTHLFTDSEDADSVRESMNRIAAVLEQDPFFRGFCYESFKEVENLNYANGLINRLYDYADSNRIWIY